MKIANKMSNKPLSVQIWIVFAAITLFISIVLALAIPLTLRDFFTEEMYVTIESAQSLMFNRYDIPSLRDFFESGGEDSEQTLEDIKTVNHFFIYEDYQLYFSSPLAEEFGEQVKEQAQMQKTMTKRYSGNIGDEKIFYVIAKGETLDSNDIYLVSYMWDSYRDDMVNTLFQRLALVMLLVFLLSWIPALLLSKYLTNPLVNLEKKVNKLANYEWNDPIVMDRKDEIGKLGDSIEELRNQLIKQNEMQQSFLQKVSHELKTPVMVIRSYTQAIMDGIYPKDDLDSSVKVIDEEAERLEKRIKNLLFLTKLDYLNTNDISMQNFSLDTLIKDVVERMAWDRTNIDWQLELPPTNIYGDLEQWRIVIENLIDNQIRYAKNTILISITPQDNKILLRFFNDGESIEPEVLDSLFSKFNKGQKGEFGLGLAIVYRIVSLHKSKIWACNEENGVSFYVEIPMKN